MRLFWIEFEPPASESDPYWADLHSWGGVGVTGIARATGRLSPTPRIQPGDKGIEPPMRRATDP